MTNVINKGSTPGTDTQSSSGGGSGGSKSLYKGVIVEFLNDPSKYTDASLQEKYGIVEGVELSEEEQLKKVANPDMLLGAPRNSCIIRIVSNGADKQSGPVVAYPFFPPHFCFPAKPGEQVWIMAEDSASLSKMPYWLCRIPESNFVDDVNYTHSDRKNITKSELSTSEKLEAQSTTNENTIPTFPNGDDKSASDVSLRTEGDVKELPFEEQDNSYDVLVSNSESYSDFQPEIVPRLTKRPGDTVLQGSNNTAIILGEDRGWVYGESATSAENSNAVKSESKDFCGTIDLVAGRGRFLPSTETTKSSIGENPSETAPRLIANERLDGVSYIENDKNPEANDLSLYPPEGDPDLTRDSSRAYISMKTNGDKNFGISQESQTMATGIDSSIEDVDDSPYVVLKSDEVRIIARKDNENSINGSIRIVKQGSTSDDLATVVLLPDGTIQISGNKIYLGRSTTDGGAGGGPGAGESQPYVKYQDLENLWSAFMDEMSAFCDKVLTHTTPGYGAPSIQLNDAATALKSAIEATHKPDIATVKSERIFGE